MDSIHAFFLGVVQGLTEFLPISSSGHLLAFHEITNAGIFDSLRFDAALHVGTLVAIIVYFWRDVVEIVQGFFRSLRSWQVKTDAKQKQAWTVIVGSIPAGIAGMLGEKWIEDNTRNLWLVVITLVIGAVAFWLAEVWSRRQQQHAEVSYATAWVVGLAQVLALIPGISRSGATIVAGLGRKLDRVAAARFAFLVSIPVVTGAGALKLTDIIRGNPSSAEVFNVVLGVVTSAVVGYIAIRFLLKFVQRHSLSAFAWYRMIAAGALVVYLLVR
ncbi:MAG: undecaprenyl-diphosphatase UppP [Patescibacteria group bacterium]